MADRTGLLVGILVESGERGRGEETASHIRNFEGRAGRVVGETGLQGPV